MTAQILPFAAPANSAPAFTGPAYAGPAVPGRRVDGERIYTFADMIRLLGLMLDEHRTAVATLRLYVTDKHMPPPRNARPHGRRLLTGADAIGKRSIWNAAMVDSWRAAPGAPGGAALPAPAPGLRAAMRGRAAALNA